MTSSAVSGLPLWKVTPERSRMVQTVAFEFGVIDSASRSWFCAFRSKPTSGSYREMIRAKSTLLTPRCASTVSDPVPPVRPARSVPPILGLPAGAAVELAGGADDAEEAHADSTAA